MTQPDPWTDLRAYTAARLALGRAGSSLPTREILRFGLAHAQARDAVQKELDGPAVAERLRAEGLQSIPVTSAAGDRPTFLLRPDLGRRLSESGRRILQTPISAEPGGERVDFDHDLVLVIADGLSAPAIERNAVPMIAAIRRQTEPDWRFAPVVIATQARVALGDEIGELLGARLVAMLIGERPGLSSPDSLGIYLTWQPRVGRKDSQRNCISNIRPEGLDYDAAAHRLWWLCREARKLGLTGVKLKDRSGLQLPGSAGNCNRIIV